VERAPTVSITEFFKDPLKLRIRVPQRDSYPADALKKGIEVEYEHTSNKLLAELIAKHHLDESLEYYDKLEIMERSFNPNDSVLPGNKKEARLFSKDQKERASMPTSLATPPGPGSSKKNTSDTEPSLNANRQVRLSNLMEYAKKKKRNPSITDTYSIPKMLGGPPKGELRVTDEDRAEMDDIKKTYLKGRLEKVSSWYANSKFIHKLASDKDWGPTVTVPNTKEPLPKPILGRNPVDFTGPGLGEAERRLYTYLPEERRLSRRRLKEYSNPKAMFENLDLNKYSTSLSNLVGRKLEKARGLR